MELDRIGVCELDVWQLEPLAGLDRILANTDKGHDSLSIESSSITDGLQENAVEFVNLSAMFGGSALYSQRDPCKEVQGGQCRAISAVNPYYPVTQDPVF